MNNIRPKNANSNNTKSDDRDKAIGRLIQELRKTAGVSQWELSEEVAISQAKLSLFESGHKDLNHEELTRVMDALQAAIATGWDRLREKREFCAAADAWIAFLSNALSPEAQKHMGVEAARRKTFSKLLDERQSNGPTLDEERMLKLMRKLLIRKRIEEVEQELAELRAQLDE